MYHYWTLGKTPQTERKKNYVLIGITNWSMGCVNNISTQSPINIHYILLYCIPRYRDYSPAKIGFSHPKKLLYNFPKHSTNG